MYWQIDAVITHPRFPLALKAYRSAMKDAFRARPGLHRYVSGSRRFLLHTLAFYLHVARNQMDDSDGLTFRNLRTVCSSIGLASPGMVHLYLQSLRAHRLIVLVATKDKRVRRFEPTEKMIGQVREHTRANLVPVDTLFPNIGALNLVDFDPEFVYAVRRIMGDTFLEQGSPVRPYPEVNYFAERASGHMILLHLMEAVSGPDFLPQSTWTKIDLELCGQACGVSRVHVAKVFSGAAARGLIVIEGPPGGRTIRPMDLLINKFLEWTATQFSFYAYCATEAIAERTRIHRGDPWAIPRTLGA